MTPHAVHDEGGFSLIELMVAMTVGLLLVAGLLYTVIGSRHSYRFNEAMSRIQENGRFAAYILSRNIRAADYMGCAAGSGRIDNTLDASANLFLRQFDAGLDGFDNVGNQWPMTLAGALSGEEHVDGTDIIVVRKVSDRPVTTGDIEEYETYMVTDCSRAIIYEAQVEKDTGERYGVDGDVYSWQSTIYYLAENSGGEVASLWQQESNSQKAIELIRGVRDMQISYGKDTDSDLMADAYVPASEVTNMNNVIGVRIALLLTSVHEVARQPIAYEFSTFQDSNPDSRHLHREFVITATLRNRGP